MKPNEKQKKNARRRDEPVVHSRNDVKRRKKESLAVNLATTQDLDEKLGSIQLIRNQDDLEALQDLERPMMQDHRAMGNMNNLAAGGDLAVDLNRIIRILKTTNGEPAGEPDLEEEREQSIQVVGAMDKGKEVSYMSQACTVTKRVHMKLIRPYMVRIYLHTTRARGTGDPTAEVEPEKQAGASEICLGMGSVVVRCKLLLIVVFL